MLSIAYTSSATEPMSEDDIAAILLKSRANNRRFDITGSLMYRGQRFVQILEGPDEIVRERFALISEDSRHKSVQTIRELRLIERQFPEWTMGFRPLSDESVAQLEGFEDFFGRTGRARIEHAENEAQQFLEWLGEYWLPKA